MVPAAASDDGRYPIATGAFRLTPKPPEVTVPIGWDDVSSANSDAPSRTGARPSGLKPTRRRGAPFSNCARIASAPGNPPGRATPLRRLLLLDHSSAPSTGVVLRSRSWP